MEWLFAIKGVSLHSQSDLELSQDDFSKTVFITKKRFRHEHNFFFQNYVLCSKSIFESCNFVSSGGAIFSVSPCQIEDSLFFSCSGLTGGAISSSNEINISYCFFDYCTADFGAAMYHNYCKKRLNVSHSSIFHCPANEYASLDHSSEGPFDLTFSNFSHIYSKHMESAIHIFSGPALLKFNIFTNLISNKNTIGSVNYCNNGIFEDCIFSYVDLKSSQFNKESFSIMEIFYDCNIIFKRCSFSKIYLDQNVISISSQSHLICYDCCFSFSRSGFVGNFQEHNCLFESECKCVIPDFQSFFQIFQPTHFTPIILQKLSPIQVHLCRIFCLSGGFTITYTFLLFLNLVIQQIRRRKIK